MLLGAGRFAMGRKARLIREGVGEDSQHILEEAKVGLNNGADYGAGYQGFLRINLATSRAILLEALDRLEKAVRSRSD